MALQTGSLVIGAIGTIGTSLLTPLSTVRVPRPLSNIVFGDPLTVGAARLITISVVRVPRTLSNVIVGSTPGGTTTVLPGSGSYQYWG